MSIVADDASKIAADIVKAALSGGALKLYGVSGNIADPVKNAAIDGAYIASVYKLVYSAVRGSS